MWRVWFLVRGKGLVFQYKYRRVIYQCNHKYANGCKCKTPHLTEDEIKERFIQTLEKQGTLVEEFYEGL